MALSIVNDPKTGAVRQLVIACETCGTSVDDVAIAAQGGLTEMGWLRRFNSAARRNEYFCPEHRPA